MVNKIRKAQGICTLPYCGILLYHDDRNLDSYRSDYLINVLTLTDNRVLLFNTLTSVIPFVLNFFIAMYIDGRKKGKSGKFRPLALLEKRKQYNTNEN